MEKGKELIWVEQAARQDITSRRRPRGSEEPAEQNGSQSSSGEMNPGKVNLKVGAKQLKLD